MSEPTLVRKDFDGLRESTKLHAVMVRAEVGANLTDLRLITRIARLRKLVRRGHPGKIRARPALGRPSAPACAAGSRSRARATTIASATIATSARRRWVRSATTCKLNHLCGNSVFYVDFRRSAQSLSRPADRESPT